MFPHGIRFGVRGSCENERFVVVTFPDEPRAPGHIMTTREMTEADFRAWLKALELSPAEIERMVAGARSAPGGLGPLARTTTRSVLPALDRPWYAGGRATAERPEQEAPSSVPRSRNPQLSCKSF